MDNLKKHWETVYGTKQPSEVSWTQEKPETSLDFIHSFPVDKKAPIIDIGGGDSKLVDHLLSEGYENLTVLDISEKALSKVKNRLGPKAEKVKWIVSDVTAFTPSAKYSIWHDRATFHFLTTQEHIQAYLEVAESAVDGYIAIGTFSDNGPEKCSGLTIKQYSEAELTRQLDKKFEKLKCITENHVTPFNTKQNFLFCSFKTKN